MYIKRLKNWDNRDWEEFYKKYPAIETKEDKARVQLILTGSKQKIEVNEYELIKYGIVNGIGPGYFGAFFRNIITFLFSGVKYFWHDIEYSIEGTIKDKIRADNGLLKYSLLGFYDNLINLSNLSMNVVFKIVYICVYIPLGLIQILLAIFCWAMVRICGNSAFTFKK